VTTAFAWLAPKGTARVAAVIPNPGLAFIAFLQSEVSCQPTAGAAEPTKHRPQRAAARMLIPQAMPIYSRGQDFLARNALAVSVYEISGTGDAARAGSRIVTSADSAISL